MITTNIRLCAIVRAVIDLKGIACLDNAPKYNDSQPFLARKAKRQSFCFYLFK